MELVCLALVTCGAVLGHIMHSERKRDGVVAKKETGCLGRDRSIPKIQPLQACVEVASCPTGQSDVIPLDGCLRLDANFLMVI